MTGRRRTTVVSRALCCLTAVALSPAAIRTSAQGTGMVPAWTVAFKKGEISTYRGKTVLAGKSGDGKTDWNLIIKPTQKIEIKDVNARGDATLVFTPVEIEVTEQGKSQKIDGSQFPSSTLVFSKAGILLKEDPEEHGASQLLVIESLVSNFPAPASPVKAGDSWRNTFDDKLASGRKAVMTTTYLGAEKVYGINTVKTRFTLLAPTAPDQKEADQIRVEGVRNIDITTGRIIRSEATIRNIEITLPDGTAKGSATLSSHLVAPGVNDAE